MFGNYSLPKKVQVPSRAPFKNPLNYPSIKPGQYPHFGRSPNTSYERELKEYKMKKEGEIIANLKNDRRRLNTELLNMQQDQHAEKRNFKKELNLRVQAKLQEYEAQVEKRREKLRELFCKEEREFYYETVDQAQKGHQNRLQEAKIRAAELKAKKEAERMAIVEEKRFLQYRDRCYELLPYLYKKNLIETKHCQLQQMRENEMRREIDRETDAMWQLIQEKESAAMKDREEREAFLRAQYLDDLQKTWSQQIKGKQLLKEEEQRMKEEDRLDVERIRNEMMQEKLSGLGSEIKKREEFARELKQQIEEHQKLLKEKQMREQAVDRAFSELAQQELQKERDAAISNAEQFKRELNMYMEHLKDLEERRKEEQKALDKMLQEEIQMMQNRVDEARCKDIMAKEELKQEVLRVRAEQLKYKQQQLENERKMKEMENEFNQITLDMNKKLSVEYWRAKAEEVYKYRADLAKQIEYRKALKQKEKEKMEDQLEAFRKEEALYRDIVDKMMKGEYKSSGTHPFKHVLEQTQCCPFKVNCPPLIGNNINPKRSS